MKILIISSVNFQLVFEHINNLHKFFPNTYTIDLFSYEKPNKDILNYNAFENIFYCLRPKYSSKIPNRLNNFLWDCKIFTKLFFLKSKYDICHIHYLHERLAFSSYIISKKSKKTIISIWGSDFYRQKDNIFKINLKLIHKADMLTFSRISIKNDLVEKYPELKNKHIEICPFGIGTLDSIDKYSNISKIEIKKHLNLPLDSFIITCGTNGSFGQQHFDIIKSFKNIKNSLPKNIFLVFPMTYGTPNKDYIENIITELDKLNIEYKILEKFLTYEQLAMYRIVSDVLIQVQITDVISGAMLEHLYANNIIITGKWLNYEILKSMGVYFIEIDYLYDLEYFIEKTIADIEKNFELACINHKIIGENFKWDKTILNWKKLYEIPLNNY